MTPRLIYAVFGETGEYSAHTSWPVAAFLDEEKAKARVVLCDEQAKVLVADGWHISLDHEDRRDAVGWPERIDYDEIYAEGYIPPGTEADPNILIYAYGGTSYYYETIPIEDWPEWTTVMDNK